MQKLIVTGLLLFVLILVPACSRNSQDFVSPDANSDDLSFLLPQSSPDLSNHHFLGSWTIEFNIENLSANLVEDRILNQHYNVTSLIPAPIIIVNSWNPATETVDVDVILRNPYFLDVYDVRMIIYTDDAGHMLLNDDSWIALYDIPEGMPINPFRAFARDIDKRKFAGTSSHQENLKIKCPNGNFTVQFAVDASYPGNCEEPYEIVDFTQGVINDDSGSTCDINVTINDWQVFVWKAYLYCPSLYEDGLDELNKIEPIKWKGTLVNRYCIPSGNYPACIIGVSAECQSVPLYKVVTIHVSHTEENWALIWGGKQIPYEEITCDDIVTDNEGNLYVTGLFRGNIDLNPGPQEDWHRAHLGWDSYLSKFDNNMNFVWSKSWGACSSDTTSITADYNGNIYVTAGFMNSIDFDPGSGVERRTSNGEQDIFISKFSPDGTFIRVLTWGGIEGDICLSMTCDRDNNLYASGCFHGEVDFDSGTGVEIHIAQDEKDAYISKFDQNGNFMWVKTIGGTSSQVFTKCKYYNADYLLCTGLFNDTVDFDPGSGICEYTSAGDRDALLWKITTDGEMVFTKVWGGICWDVSLNSAVDGSGNIYISGFFSGTVDFYPDSPPDSDAIRTANGYTDAFLIKLDSEGLFKWVNTWGSYNDFSDRADSLFVDSSGSVYTCSNFNGPADFDPSPEGVEFRTSSNYINPYLLKLNSNGDFAWVQTWDGWAYSAILSSSDDIAIVGDFDYFTDFDLSPGIDLRATLGPAILSSKSVYLLRILTSGDRE
jgi:hypothetical protein